MASEDITPSQLVYSKHFNASYWLEIPPLEITGIFNSFLIFLMMSQLASPTWSLFYCLVLPCTVTNEAPFSSILLTKFRVLWSSLNIQIFTLKGTGSLEHLSTMLRTLSSYSNRKDPYKPRLAIYWGHPKFKSIMSIENLLRYFIATW